MVECQIVALKVSGSTPGIYPILLKSNWLIVENKILTNNYNNFIILNFLSQNFLYHKSLFKKFFLMKNTFFCKKFNVSYKLFFKKKLDSSCFKLYNKSFTLSKNNLYFFVKLTNSVINKKLNIHHSYSSYYYQTSANINVININKLFSLWKNIINFLVNLFYFNLKYLVFSNSYFKYEVLSLNWKATNNLTHIWKYTDIFFFFINSKMTLINILYFKNFLLNNFKCVFVIDLYYHKNTLHFLNKFKFITIGPVPLFSNLYSFYISVPTVSNSIFSNLFFLRLVLKLKKLNSNLNWKNFKKIYK